jgi:hypothetical protein
MARVWRLGDSSRASFIGVTMHDRGSVRTTIAALSDALPQGDVMSSPGRCNSARLH